MVKAHIERIHQVNPLINAVVEFRFEQALLEAKEKDSLVSKNKNLGPLHGVPFTVKEMLTVSGMRHTLGSIHRREQRKDRTATVVQRILDAGGIILGTTNVPELGFWFECHNNVYGTTKNPYDHSRTSGGSSGGEAAIIASAGSPFGIGSDVGGSIRLPAGFCGVFGHKPTEHWLPITGHVPTYHETMDQFQDKKYPFTVVGPIAKKAKDLRPLFELMMGPDGIDTQTQKKVLGAPVKKWEDIQVFYLSAPVLHGCSETEKEISDAVKNSVRALEQYGAQTQELDEKILLHAFNIWTARAWSIEGRDFSSLMTNDEPVDYFEEIAKALFKRSKYTLPALMTAFLDQKTSNHDQHPEFLKQLGELKTKLSKFLGPNCILILPVHPRLAPKHHSTYLRPFDFSYTGVFNAVGLPASAATVGHNDQGLPIAVQVVAGFDQDHLCFSACEALEEIFGGWVAPGSKTSN